MRSALPLAAAVLLALAAAGCDQGPAPRQQAVEVQTIENAPPRLSAADPPRTLEERSLPARPAVPQPRTSATDTAPPTPEEEMMAKTNLPFTPLIAMDPVDGSKVSITPQTPVISYKDRWYYFSSPANKAAFRANPETYAEGQLSKY